MLSAARGVPYIGALASALYIPSAGTGSARVPGRDEFWYEEELRKKALVGGTATTRVRFSGEPTFTVNRKSTACIPAKVLLMKTCASRICCGTMNIIAMNLRLPTTQAGR